MAPKAFRTPISAVLSVTETNMIFISPMAAPNRVSVAITMVPNLKLEVISLSLSRIPSLLRISKSFFVAIFSAKTVESGEATYQTSSRRCCVITVVIVAVLLVVALALGLGLGLGLYSGTGSDGGT